MQEEELQEREAASARLTHSLQELQREHTAALAEAAAAGAANDELRGKLDDCAQQLKGNEQMIRWLNAQVLFCAIVTKRWWCSSQGWTKRAHVCV